MRNQLAVNTGATSHDPDSLFPFGKKASGSLHLLDGEFLMGDGEFLMGDPDSQSAVSLLKVIRIKCQPLAQFSGLLAKQEVGPVSANVLKSCVL